MQIADANCGEESVTLNIYLTVGYKLISQRNNKLINIQPREYRFVLLRKLTFVYILDIQKDFRVVLHLLKHESEKRKERKEQI